MYASDWRFWATHGSDCKVSKSDTRPRWVINTTSSNESVRSLWMLHCQWPLTIQKSSRNLVVLQERMSDLCRCPGFAMLRRIGIECHIDVKGFKMDEILSTTMASLNGHRSFPCFNSTCTAQLALSLPVRATRINLRDQTWSSLSERTLMMPQHMLPTT